MNITINEKIDYIIENINNLNKSNRIEVLCIVMETIDHDKIMEKGNGTYIKFKDLDNTLICNIYAYIYNKIQINTNEFIINI